MTLDLKPKPYSLYVWPARSTEPNDTLQQRARRIEDSLIVCVSVAILMDLEHFSSVYKYAPRVHGNG